MREIEFGQWAEVLAHTDLPERQKASWAITLKWYLGFCRRARAGVNVQSARGFIAWVQREKQPEPWQVERWKEALNWLFREGKSRQAGGGATPNIQHPTSNVQRSTIEDDKRPAGPPMTNGRWQMANSDMRREQVAGRRSRQWQMANG
jgi:hypothetical protein